MFRLVVLPVFAFVFRRMNHPNKISFVRSTSSSSAVGTILSCTNNNNRMVQPTILTDTLSSSSSSLASDERDNNSPPKLDHTIIINDSYHGNYSNNNNRLQVERCTSAQLRRAAGSQSLSVLQQALQGWTVEEIDNIASEEVGKNPVHIAAWQGCMENLQYLIEFMGCNVNRIAEGKYCYGKTPLFFALTRSREEIIDYLLQNGAYVKIVNNKGQSVLSIAASHVSDPIIQQIQYQETKCTQEWMNYRMTHSDSLEYGDLDPRFMDRPLRATDIVTALVINPTTKQTRKGGFLRRNPEIATREAFNRNEKLMLQKMKQQQAQSTTSSLSLADEDALREAWESLEQCFERSDDTISSLTYIQQIILINDQQH